MTVVLSLLPRTKSTRDWTNDELAELYRVKHALGQANVALEVDQGVTDEGDPWFIFCRYDGEVLVHVARYDGLYHLFSPALSMPLVGTTFSDLTKSFISKVPTKNEASTSSNVIRHPSALLSLLVVTIFFSIDYLTGHGYADATPLVPARTPASGHDGAVRSVVSNMLASVGNAEADDILESAYLAGQAAVLFIGSSVTLYEGASSVPTTAAQEAIAGALTDGVVYQTDVTAPATLAASPEVGSGSATTEAKSGVAVTVAQPHAYEALMSAPVASAAAPAAISPPMATPSPKAFEAFPVETPGQNVHPVNQILVLASPAGSEVNLSGDSSVHWIQLVGNGPITLSGLSGNGSQAIEVLGSSVETLKLEYSRGASSPKQTLEIADGSSVTLQSVSVQGETSGSTVSPTAETAGSIGSAVYLTVDSTGNHPNTLTVSDAAVQSVTLNLTIVGSQDLTLKESAKVLNDSSLNASGLHGQLTVGLDLSGSPNPMTLVGSSDFVVNDNGIVALVNVPDHATIQVATNLESVLTQFAGVPSDHSISLELQSIENASTPVSISIVKVDGTTTLGLNSGGDASVVNKVGTLIDSNLQDLQIRGSGSLSIGSIIGVTSANDQDITIDASQLKGGLSMDVSGIPDVAGGGRQITIIGGQGNNVLTNATATEATTFVAGGQDIFNVADGAQSVTVKGLHGEDTVVVGGGTTADTVVDATRLPNLSGAYLNSLSLPTAAAAVAVAAGVAAAHQAVVFNYQDNLYVFVDTAGNHIFDASADALIQIVGMSKAVDLSHVFFSA